MSVDGTVSLDGSGLRSSPSGNSSSSGNLGHSVVVGGLFPGSVSSNSLLVSDSSVVSPVGLDLSHSEVVASSVVESTGPDVGLLSSVPPSGEPDVSDVSLVVHDLDGVLELVEGSQVVLLGHLFVVDGGVVSMSGFSEGFPGSDSVVESFVVSVDGLVVNVDGMLVSGNSSSELSGELFVELGSVAGVVVGFEVSEGLVFTDGIKSHVLLDELSSGSLSSLEGFLVVEEREVTEVSVGGGGGSNSGGSDEGDLSEHCYCFINYSLDSSISGHHNPAN